MNTYVLVLDEPSNHLDVEAVSALQQALLRYDGALVVITHDQAFARGLHPTHVAYVNRGQVTVEERALRPSDWREDDASFFVVNSKPCPSDGGTTTKPPPLGGGSSTAAAPLRDAAGERVEEEDEDDEDEEEGDPKAKAARRQQAYKQKGQLGKVEEKIATLEAEGAALEEQMVESGTDVGALLGLQEKKETLDAELQSLYDKWEAIETLVAEFPDL